MSEGSTFHAITPENPNMAASASLRVAKKALRTHMKSKLSSIPKSMLDSQSQVVRDSLLGFEAYKTSNRISIYLSMPSGEIQTDSIVRSALSSGKKVFVPYLYPNKDARSDGPRKVMDMVSLHNMQDYESLARDSWGIPTVSEESLGGRERILGGEKGGKGLDMVLLPGVAFEVIEGAVERLGHGRGFYDCFLEGHATLYGEKKALLYGLGLEEQIVSGSGQEHVPVGPLDKKLDGLLIGDGRIVDSSIHA